MNLRKTEPPRLLRRLDRDWRLYIYGIVTGASIVNTIWLVASGVLR